MGRWLDRLARRAAPRPPSPTAAAQPAPGSSRRDFLKKAAVVTGAAWTVPVMQTALAPAYAASGGVGSACSSNGEVCTGDNSRCFNLICGGSGAICSGGEPCLYGNCAAGICGGEGAIVPGGCPASGLSVACASGKCFTGGQNPGTCKK